VYLSKASVTQRSDIIKVTPSMSLELIKAPKSYPVICNSRMGYWLWNRYSSNKFEIMPSLKKYKRIFLSQLSYLSFWILSAILLLLKFPFLLGKFFESSCWLIIRLPSNNQFQYRIIIKLLYFFKFKKYLPLRCSQSNPPTKGKERWLFNKLFIGEPCFCD